MSSDRSKCYIHPDLRSRGNDGLRSIQEVPHAHAQHASRNHHFGPAAFASTAPARAQTTDVRFVLDFLLQGQQSAFVLGRERGYYTAQKVNLAAFDPGRGGADSITKVASGTHDIGFGDLSAMIEFNAKNPGRELIAVLLVYDQAPLSLISLKKSGIQKPADLMGRKGGAPTVDATYRLFNVFARVNGIDPARVQWTTVQPQVREPLLVRGEIDFAAAWVMTAVPSLLGLGVKQDDINVMMLRDHGLDLYANAVFTTPAFAKQHPGSGARLRQGDSPIVAECRADPDASVAALKRASRFRPRGRARPPQVGARVRHHAWRPQNRHRATWIPRA